MRGINQPRWKEPEYTKREINNAGKIVQSSTASKVEYKDAQTIIDNWRGAHAYPLHVFYMNLRRRAGVRQDIIVVERLKRLSSIIEKLRDENDMQLYRMQDLGGCRMVLPAIEEVYKYSHEFQNSRIRHEAKTSKDYIQQPKSTGYRSLHLIYKFKTDTPDKEIFNQYPMLIELQFRTHLQHIWATAVEAFGLLVNQRLKSGKGDKDYIRFFVLVSSLFAIQENCPLVPGTVGNVGDLVSEIKQINNQHHILDKLSAMRIAASNDNSSTSDQKGYYILKLDYKSRILNRYFFKPSEIEKANKYYDYLEQNRENEYLDIVLVRAASFTTVKKAYPNYFLDIGEFIRIVRKNLQ